MLLAMAMCAECLHEILAIASFKYFWTTGLADVSGEGASAAMPLAYVMVLLHVAGLLGTIVLVSGYARCYLAAWRELGVRRPKAGRRRAAKPEGPPDVEAGKGRRVSDEDIATAAGAAPSHRPPRAPDRAGNDVRAGPSGPRQAGRDASPRRPDSDSQDGPPRRNSKQSRSPRGGQGPPGAGGYRSESPRDAEERAKPDQRPPLGTPPRAWLWVANDPGGEWVRVRVLRSSATDGTATVRLPGGGVTVTRNALLRPRVDDEEPPPPPAQPPRDRPASASGARPSAAGFSPFGRPRGPSKERPSSADGSGRDSGRGSEGGFGDKPPAGGAVPPGCMPFFKAEAPSQKEPPKVESEEERWAGERLLKLRKELQECDKMEPGDRRARLRALQRELHPDKQPEAMRKYAEPLFHIVQREWEVTEALRAEEEGKKNGGG
mmetsp:Transcript_36657/g.66262  ORF Transcript_36657/g.66262 Transcript_36657/m.66262 type:complete len:434 (+) Transcript_36657:2-1303(+)